MSAQLYCAQNFRDATIRSCIQCIVTRLDNDASLACNRLHGTRSRVTETVWRGQNKMNINPLKLHNTSENFRLKTYTYTHFIR